MRTYDLLKELQSETKLHILQYLYYEGEAKITELAKFAEKNVNNISNQIGQLRRNEIVIKRKQGRLSYYSINFIEMESDLIGVL